MFFCFARNAGSANKCRRDSGDGLDDDSCFCQIRRDTNPMSIQKHYVAYHNEETWGERKNLKWVDTAKNVAGMEGARIWIISGGGQPRRYHLCFTFIAEQTGSNKRGKYRNWVGSTKVQAFAPPVRLNGFNWFPRLFKTLGHFAFGLQSLRDPSLIKKLEALRKNPTAVASQYRPTANPCELEQRTRELLAAPMTAKPKGQKRPKKVRAEGMTFERDPAVIAYVLQAAKGHCELCGKSAPFQRGDGSPFLEVHHFDPLAEGGADTVQNAAALCPNCHRHVHHGEDAAAQRTKLKGKMRRRK
jgi:5-methylcytosine-specific restriction endonuclease McrA